jgi:hypothetical protein
VQREVHLKLLSIHQSEDQDEVWWSAEETEAKNCVMDKRIQVFVLEVSPFVDWEVVVWNV